jgi:osmotically-inducible protein OsmY
MKSDMDLKNDVLVELKWEPGVNAVAIGVAVKEGVVVLTGYVETFGKASPTL